MEPLLTVKEVKDVLRLSRNQVYLLAKAGKIPCIRIGASYRFRASELDAWIKKGLHSGHEISERQYT